MASVHKANVLAEFQNGESALVFARHQEDPLAPLFHIPYDGATKSVKALTREHLECFMPDCADRRLKAMHRSTKRDGFSHMPGSGGHLPEGLFHQQSKALIASWVRGNWPGVRADVELATETRDRIADVMLTWVDGARVAVEIQYSAITVDAWLERHLSYRAQGIVDVWLFGHTGNHMHTSHTGQLSLSPVHEAVVAAGLPLLWINPISAEIGMASNDRRAAVPPQYGWQRQTYDDGWDVRSLPVPIRSAKGDFYVNALNHCTPTPEGISVPTWVQLAANAVQLDKVDAARAVVNVDIMRRAAEEEQAKRERSKRNVETKLRRRAFAQQRQAEQEAEWLAQPMRASVLAANGGQIPSFLDVKPAVNGVYAHHQHWQSWLYGIHIRGKTGSSFSMADLYETLNQAGIQLSPNAAKRSRAVRDWIDHLELNAHVVADREQDNSWRITVIDRDKRLAARALHLKQTQEAAQARSLANFKRNLEAENELRDLAAKNEAKYGRRQSPVGGARP
jgi:hypothetical protein